MAGGVYDPVFMTPQSEQRAASAVSIKSVSVIPTAGVVFPLVQPPVHIAIVVKERFTDQSINLLQYTPY
jgi:hypothetical protein